MINYSVINNAISKELAEFLANYLLIKEQVCFTMGKQRYTNYTKEHGLIGDDQVANTYALYGDVAMDSLLLKLHKPIEEIFKCKLYPTYTYSRVYRTGSELKKHTDRPECKLSTTLNLGGDPWAIYLEVEGKDIEFILKPGDMLAYRGCDFTHWRKPFEGKVCVQTFLHYTDQEKLTYDTRPHIGLPGWFARDDV